MSANNLLTPSMLAKELNIGTATVRFWLNRFSRWLPYIEKDGEKLYQAESLNTLRFISDKINLGIIPTEIDNDLENNAESIKEQNQTFTPSLHSFTPQFQSVIQNLPDSNPVSQINQQLQLNESIQLISTLFEKFYSQQERIASAQERKAAAEEVKAKAEKEKAEAEKIKAEAEQQKAKALEKRAEAELHKAAAMNNLADAIKNISTDFLKSLPIGTILNQLSKLNELPESKINENEKSIKNEFQNYNNGIENNIDDLDDLSALIEENEDAKNIDEDLDDLSALIEENEDAKNIDEDLDDLSALIEENEDAKNIDQDLDDLSALIEENEDAKNIDEDLDDLSALIEENEDAKNIDEDLDDLSALIDKDENEIIDDLDDLYTLIGEQQDDSEKILDSYADDIMDDLATLIDEDVSSLKPVILDSDVDNLVSLIGDDTQDDIMSDLSSLLEAEEDEKPKKPKIEKPKASLEENFEQYKAEVINIIIKLRQEGHSVEQTTEILNSEEIKPLSGKNKWTTKMIAKIYTFIDAAKR